MELTIAALAFLAAVSLCGNTWLWSERSRLTRRLAALQEAHKLAMKGEHSYDCRALLHDLTSSAGVVKITRIEPGEIFVRRT